MGDYSFSSDALQKIMKKTKNLEMIEIFFEDNFTDKELRLLGTINAGIRYLSILNNDNITKDALIDTLGHCRNIKQLAIGNSIQLDDDDFLLRMTKFAHNLEYLRLV